MCEIPKVDFEHGKVILAHVSCAIPVYCVERFQAHASNCETTIDDGQTYLFEIPNPRPDLGCDIPWWVTKDKKGMCLEALKAARTNCGKPKLMILQEFDLQS